MKLQRKSPIGALVSGILAGVVGSFALDLFFKLTGKIAPRPPPDAFEPPEPRQRGEQPNETVARRLTEGLMVRSLQRKELGGRLVHYGYGGAWGGLYGLAAQSWRPVSGIWGALGFGALVGLTSGLVVLPGFKLAGPPKRYPPSVHAYQLVEHLFFGVSVWAAFKAAQRATWRPLLGFLGALGFARRFPRPLRAPAKRAGLGYARLAGRAQRFIEARA